MDILHYLDFELVLLPAGQAGCYTARVYRSPAGEARSTFKIPFTPDRLELILLKLGNVQSATRGAGSPEIEAARELGGGLFQAVFRDQVKDVFRASLDKVHAQAGTGLRLKLRLQDAPDLAALPWEYLYDTEMGRFLAQSVYTPIVRYVELPESVLPLQVQLPLRILCLISSPTDYAPLNVEHEKKLVEDAMANLVRAGKIEITWLEQATLEKFRQTLRAGHYHIFHFIGHGGLDTTTQEGGLVFEDEQEKGVRLDAGRLGVLLHDHWDSLRLVVLNACEGARNSSADPFGGVATTLVRQGIPAVVAMQFPISDEGATKFGGEFYAALATGLPVDAALAEARKALYTLPDDVEWGTPVMYLRAEDGVLFNLTSPAKTEPTLKDHSQSHVVSPVGWQNSPIKSLIVLPEQEEPINSIAFSPDGGLIVSGGGGLDAGPSPLRLWRIADGKEIQRLAGHTGCVNTVAFSPDGRTLASGAGGIITDRMPLRLWQWPLGHELGKLQGHRDSVKSIAFSPNGRLLVSGSQDGTAWLWQIPEGIAMGKLDGHMGAVLAVAFSPDGRTLASGASDKLVRLWQVSDRKLLATLEGHTDYVSSVVCSPDGCLVASGSWDGSVRLWRLPEGTLLDRLDGHTSVVESVAFSPDGRWLASGSMDQSVRVWQIPDGRSVTLAGHTGSVHCVTFSPDGRTLASCGDDGCIRLWELP